MEIDLGEVYSARAYDRTLSIYICRFDQRFDLSWRTCNCRAGCANEEIAPKRREKLFKRSKRGCLPCDVIAIRRQSTFRTIYIIVILAFYTNDNETSQVLLSIDDINFLESRVELQRGGGKARINIIYRVRMPCDSRATRATTKRRLELLATKPGLEQEHEPATAAAAAQPETASQVETVRRFQSHQLGVIQSACVCTLGCLVAL